MLNLSFSELAIAGIGFIGTLILLISFQTAVKLSEDYVPLLDATLETKNGITEARLWLERAASSNEPGTAGEVWRRLDSAHWYALSLLPESSSDRLFPYIGGNSLLADQVQSLRKKLDRFETIARAHHGMFSQTDDSGPVSGQVNLVYREILSELNLIQELIEQQANEGIARYRVFQWLLILGGFFATFLGVWATRRVEQEKRLAYQEIEAKEAVGRLVSQQLKYVIDGANLGYWDWNCQTGEHYVNDRWLSILGLTRGDITNTIIDWQVRIHPADKHRILALFEAHKHSEAGYHAEFRMRHKRGYWVWIEGSGGVVERDPGSGLARRYCGTFRDISKRKRSENFVRDSERRFRQLIEAMPGIAVQGYSSDRRVIFWNQASESLYGFSKQEAKGMRMEQLMLPADIQSETIAAIDRWISDGEVMQDGELVMQDRYGNDVPVFSHHILLNGSERRPELFRIDVDLRKEMVERERLEQLASHDSLTHLPNRYLLDADLRNHIEESRRFGRQLGVLFLDLDGFKSVNDQYGHAVGDDLLQQVVEQMTGSLREYDILARYGGDEFVLILPSITNRLEVEKVASKLCNATDRIYRVDNHSVHTTVSIGISLFPEHADTAVDLLAWADAAMYDAKQAGKNCWRIANP